MWSIVVVCIVVMCCVTMVRVVMGMYWMLMFVHLEVHVMYWVLHSVVWMINDMLVLLEVQIVHWMLDYMLMSP